jgi:type IV pilus assembly protein PilV
MTAPTSSLRTNSPGFTLIEVMMAMLVLTVGLLGLLQSLQLGYRQSLRDRARDEAVQIAEEQMHDRRRLAFRDFTGFNREVRRKVSGGEVPFEVVGVVQKLGASAKKLTLTVSWTANAARFYHEIFTLKTRRSDEQD